MITEEQKIPMLGTVCVCGEAAEQEGGNIEQPRPPRGRPRVIHDESTEHALRANVVVREH